MNKIVSTLLLSFAFISALAGQPRYELISNCGGGVFAVTKDTISFEDGHFPDWYIIDLKGNIVSSPIKAGPFGPEFNSAGFAMVGDSERYIIDTKGNVLVPKSENPFLLENGYYVTRGADGVETLRALPDGKLVCSVPKDLQIKPTSIIADGMIPVGHAEGDDWKYGFIDFNGKEVVPVKYAKVGNFSEGLASVSLDGTYFSFVDTKGRTALAGPYLELALDDLDDEEYLFPTFTEGLAAVGVGSDEYVYIDHKGNQAIDGKFLGADRFDASGMAQVCDKEEGWITIDKTGRKVTPPDENAELVKAWPEPFYPLWFVNGYSVVSNQTYDKPENCHVIDIHGRIVLKDIARADIRYYKPA